eukprot:5523680-Karenia_brevis.AAC.1
MLGGKPPARISSSNGAARFHCQPFSTSEMAALKLIILSGKPLHLTAPANASKTAGDAWLG